MKKILVIFVLMALVTMISSADVIRGINIDFVEIGNAANPSDTGGTVGCGAVNYNYRIGKYEITNAQWNDFINASGTSIVNLSEYIGEQQPAAKMNWYEAMQFCNYLTTGDSSRGAYLFSGNNIYPGSLMSIDRETAQLNYGTVYVLPTEDEWYKAAYYNPTGNGYSIYSNGLNTVAVPDDGWNLYGGSYNEPWNVGSGYAEQNGTYDMMGNVWELTETIVHVNECIRRGGSFDDPRFPNSPSSYDADGFARSFDNRLYDVGFRIVSIPEPTTLSLFVLGLLALRRKNN